MNTKFLFLCIFASCLFSMNAFAQTHFISREEVLRKEVVNDGELSEGLREMIRRSNDTTFRRLRESTTRTDGEMVCRDVTLTEPGTLASVLGETVNDIDSIVVRGPINDDDFNTLWNSSLHGQLSVINLEYALIENETVPENAFWHPDEQVQNGWTDVIALRKIILPAHLKTIGDSAFYWAVYLEEVVMPAELENLGWYTFAECRALQTSPLILPEGLTEIPSACFYNCLNLNEVILPSTIRHIRETAFMSAKMKKIHLPEGLESMDGMAFYGSGLVEVTIPSSCQQFNGTQQFAVNYSLKSFKIKDGMRIIPERFLDNDIYLQEVEIPSSVETILRQAFNNCFELETLRLPEGVREIESEAFRSCKTMKKLEIPSTLVSLGIGAFYGVRSLEEITCKVLTPPICGVDPTNHQPVEPSPENLTFTGMSRYIPVYVPVGTADLYKEAYGWDYFSNFIETDFLVSKKEIGDDVQSGNDVYYDLTGMRIAKPIPGHLYIRNGKKIVAR